MGLNHTPGGSLQVLAGLGRLSDHGFWPVLGAGSGLASSVLDREVSVLIPSLLYSFVISCLAFEGIYLNLKFLLSGSKLRDKKV